MERILSTLEERSMLFRQSCGKAADYNSAPIPEQTQSQMVSVLRKQNRDSFAATIGRLVARGQPSILPSKALLPQQPLTTEEGGLYDCRRSQ